MEYERYPFKAYEARSERTDLEIGQVFYWENNIRTIFHDCDMNWRQGIDEHWVEPNGAFFANLYVAKVKEEASMQ